MILETGEWRVNLDAGLVPVDGLGFDGFESGDLRAWTMRAPDRIQ